MGGSGIGFSNAARLPSKDSFRIVILRHPLQLRNARPMNRFAACSVVPTPSIVRSCDPSGSFNSDERSIRPAGSLKLPVPGARRWRICRSGEARAAHKRTRGIKRYSIYVALVFRNVQFPPLHDLTADAPDGAIIGIMGENGSGTRELARLAARRDQPISGEVSSHGNARYLGPLDALDLVPVELLVLDHSLAHQDALARIQASMALSRLRASGSTILLLSHEPALLSELCDEIWWMDAGSIAAQGDPRQMLDRYRAAIAQRLRAGSDGAQIPLLPAMRKGDGRAVIIALETLGQTGEPTMTWQSGEEVSVRVVVRFREKVERPVIGIMIRTRIGLEVYGTNTELERLALGPFAAGQTVDVRFHFTCDLCPKEYTLTAASHDPDGTAHDWLDDAVAFIVAGPRYTAGVANLRARVQLEDRR